MKYLTLSQNKSGAYPPPISNFFPDSHPITDEQVDFLVTHNGFVIVTETPDPAIPGSAVTMTVNTEAWEAWKAGQPDPLNYMKEKKELEISSACNEAIVAGMEVETTKGTEHFDLTEVDQINLTTALGAVDSGAESYPYHSKKTLCRMFSADEIRAVSQAAIAHSLYHQTLCNHLLTWIRRAETEEEINKISYSAENLPQDLKENMASVLASSNNINV